MADEYLYRYEDVRYAAPLNEYDQPSGPGHIRVHLRKYLILKHTPKGVWISLIPGPIFPDDKRWVNLGARKRYACPTIEEARESFIARKDRQIGILSARLRRAEAARRLIDHPTEVEFL